MYVELHFYMVMLCMLHGVNQSRISWIAYRLDKEMGRCVSSIEPYTQIHSVLIDFLSQIKDLLYFLNTKKKPIYVHLLPTRILFYYCLIKRQPISRLYLICTLKVKSSTCISHITIIVLFFYLYEFLSLSVKLKMMCLISSSLFYLGFITFFLTSI